MKPTKKDQKSLESLRARAEVLLNPSAEAEAEAVKAYSKIETLDLIHELHTHQIELEMQNEELRLSQLELTLARDKFIELYDFSPVGYLTLDRKGIIQRVNLRFDTMLQVDREKLINLPFVTLVLPESQNVFQRYLGDLINVVMPLACEVQLKRNDSSSFWVRLESTITEPEDGAPASIRMVVTNIDEQKKSDIALNRNRQRQENLIANTKAGYFYIDKDGRFQDVNHGWLQMHGYESVDEVIGQHYSLTQVEENTQYANNIVQDFLEGHGPSTAEFSRRNKDGSIGYHMYSINPVNVDGEVIGVEGFLIDITPFKHSQIALRESDELLSKARDMGKLGSWKWDIPTNTLEWSDEMFNIFGLDRETFHGDLQKVIASAIHPDDRGLVEESNRSVIENNKPSPVEYRVIRPDGDIRVVWAEALELVLDDDGQPCTLSGIVKDITERIKAEKSIQSSRDQLRLLSQRLLSVREEERTNLARELHDGIGQALTALNFDLDYIQSMLTPEQVKIESKIKGMEKILRDTLVDVQRISGELRPRLLDELGLDDAILWFANDFGDRSGIKVTFVNKMTVRKVDAMRSIALFRILQEALTNVARHAKASEIKIFLSETSHGILLRIEDNGIGIHHAPVHDIESLGILGMEERTLPFGGTFSVQAGEHNGTVVSVTLPLNGELGSRI